MSDTNIISINNDLSSINWVGGLSDPGEMVACGAYQELRRLAGEADGAYADRIRPLVAALPAEHRDIITKAMIEAAVNRAGLDTSNGKVAVMVAGEPAWHKLGVNVAEAVDSATAIKLAGLDFIVEKQQLYLGDGSKAQGGFANVRLDTGAVLGIVGNHYKVLQNAAAFQFMDEAIGEGLARYETAGAVMGGKRIWLLARLPQELRVKGTDDVTECFGLLTNAHDGNGAVSAFATGNRVVCNNTMVTALRQGRKKKKLSVRHTTGMDGRVADARVALGLVVDQFVSLQAQMDALAAVSLKGTEVGDYFELLYPTKPPSRRKGALGTDGASVLDGIVNGSAARASLVADLLAADSEFGVRTQKRNERILEQLLDNFENEKNSLPGIRGTAWAAYNAVSEYVDHQAPSRGDDARLNSVWFGSGAEQKAEAYSLALELVAASASVSA